MRTSRLLVQDVSGALTQIAIGALLLAPIACNDLHAVVDCQNLEKYESSFGVYNAPVYGLGDILEIDTTRNVGGRVLTVVPQGTDTSGTVPVDSLTIASNVDFNVSVDATVGTAAKKLLDAQLTSYVNNHTGFFLKNFRRINITDPVARLAQTQQAAADVKSRLQRNPAHILLIVSAIITAENAQFELTDSTGAALSANVISAGQYKISVSYACQGKLTQAASKNGAVFFKYNRIVLDDSTGTLRAEITDIDLKRINLTQGVVGP